MLQVADARAWRQCRWWVAVSVKGDREAGVLHVHCQRGQRRQRELEQLAAVDAEGEAAHVDHQADMQARGWLEHAYLGGAAAGARWPVNQLARVVGAIVTHGCRSCRIDHRAAQTDHVHRWVMQRQVDPAQADDAWVDEHVHLVLQAALALEKAERIAGSQPALAEAEDAAAAAVQGAPPAQSLVWPKAHPALHPDEGRLDIGPPPDPLGVEARRQQLPYLEPRQRQRPRVRQ